MPQKVKKELGCYFKNPMDKKDIIQIFIYDKLKKIMIQKK
jgi:hypothetical protein